MLLLFEEIAVESAMILATLVALGLLVYMLVGFALEHARARQDAAPARSLTRAHSETTIGRRA
jgi:hypothetical protein